MSLARVAQARGRRPATRAPLRALATLVAVLVGLSSLGQFAHFLLVPHAICVEHGELLELSEQEGHADSHVAATNEEDAHPVESAPGGEHEHCDVLARGQHEQAQPTPRTVEISPASAAEPRLAIAAAAAARRSPSALSLAPKTSPPRAVGA